MSRSAQFLAQVRHALSILRHKRAVCFLPPSSQQTAGQVMKYVRLTKKDLKAAMKRARGARGPNMTAEEQRTIRTMYHDNGERVEDIAEHFERDRSAIYRVLFHQKQGKRPGRPRPGRTGHASPGRSEVSSAQTSTDGARLSGQE